MAYLECVKLSKIQIGGEQNQTTDGYKIISDRHGITTKSKWGMKLGWKNLESKFDTKKAKGFGITK